MISDVLYGWHHAYDFTDLQKYDVKTRSRSGPLNLFKSILHHIEFEGDMTFCVDGIALTSLSMTYLILKHGLKIVS